MPNISDFISNVSKNGVARNNRYIVTITPPSTMIQSNPLSNTYSRDLELACEAASIPQTTIATEEYRSYDLASKIAGQKTHENFDLTFRMDKDFKVYQFFNLWQTKIYDPSTGNIGYYDDYKGKVQIRMLDNAGYSRFQITADEAYPVSINAVDLGWASDGEYVKLQVSFAYKKLEFATDSTSMANTQNSTVPDPVDNSLQPVKNAISQAQSMLKSNLKTSVDGKYIPLTGLLNI